LNTSAKCAASLGNYFRFVSLTPQQPSTILAAVMSNFILKAKLRYQTFEVSIIFEITFLLKKIQAAVSHIGSIKVINPIRPDRD